VAELACVVEREFAELVDPVMEPLNFALRLRMVRGAVLLRDAPGCGVVFEGVLAAPPAGQAGVKTKPLSGRIQAGSLRSAAHPETW
jgi:hypothetical protein